MTQKLILTLITFSINIVILSAQDPTFIGKTASNVFLSLSQNESLPVSELDKLNAILSSEIEDIELEEEYFTTRSHIRIMNFKLNTRHFFHYRLSF